MYITFLVSIPSLSAGLRASINHNLTEIIQLHEEILGDLHRVVPNSEYTQPEIDDTTLLPSTKGYRRSQSTGPIRRRKSLDVTAEKPIYVPGLHNIPGVLSEPQVAAEVARIFGKKVQFA